MPGSKTSYQQALRKGQQCVAERKARHLDPYLPVLDEYLESVHIRKRRAAGVKEVLTSRVVGTCHRSRTESFAHDFMPLLEEGSEFAAKWESLYHSAVDEGLRDPIKVYELFGRYFVEEGNKRVSVTKFISNPLISADIVVLELDPNEIAQGELYEEYLKFVDITGIGCILLSSVKSYRRLLKLLDASKTEHLSALRRDQVLSLFYSFEAVFGSMKDEPLRIDSSEAFLLFLEVYGWQPDEIIPDSQLKQELLHLWPAIEAWPSKKTAALMTRTELSEKKPVLSFLLEPVKAALIEQGCPAASSWTAAHQQGFEEMKKHLGDKVQTRIYSDAATPEELEQDVRDAIDWGAQVVFTSHPLMLQMTNQFAAKYPKVRFLNCSLNPEATSVRSYYTRGYEVLFLLGMAAGAMTSTPGIGFIADYPIYGSLADINAFAIGVSCTRPDAKVYLEWSTTTSSTNREFPLHMDFIYIAGQDFDTRIAAGKRFGLFDVREGQFLSVASVEQKWGVFYSRIIQSILNRTYSHDEQLSSTGSINYWLGLSNGLLDLTLSDHLPFEMRRVIEVMKSAIAHNEFFVFGGLRHRHPELKGIYPLNADEIIKMDWLVDNIVGTIPSADELLDTAEKLARMHGIEPDEDEEGDHEQ